MKRAGLTAGVPIINPLIFTDTIIQDAVAYFANACPHCQRELDFYVSPEEIQSWLEKQSYGDENE